MMKSNASQLISLLDLTSLSDSDTRNSIQKLCGQAMTPLGPVAAVCIYPKFVGQVKNLLAGTTIKVATVANFPGGDWTLVDCVAEIKRAVQEGADEIDVVMPYQVYLDRNREYAFEFLQACRSIMGAQITMKVILEVGALINPVLIADATELAIASGADFIKTATGKLKVNTTLQSAEIILNTIKEHSDKNVGFKAAGGITTVEQANEYLQLAEKIMDSPWISPKTMRFGASKLLQNILVSG